MLCLEVDAPLDRVVELLAALYEYIHRLGIRYAAEVIADDVMQTLQQPFVDKGVEKLHLLRAALKRAVDDILDHCLGSVHIVVEISKRHFRLDHPELRRVALGVRHLGAERRSERVHVAERHGKVLGVELAGYSEAGWLAEEVLAVVDRAVLLAGEVIEVERRDSEHLPRALAVGAGDYRGVYIHEPAALEKLMHRLRRDASHAERRGEEIRAGSEMLYSAQKLHAVALFLQGVIRRGRALDSYFVRLELKQLLCLRREDERAMDDERRADVLPGDLLVIFERAALKHDLKRLEAAAVVQLDKAEVFHVADGSHPAADCHALPAEGGSVGKYAGDFLAFHSCTFFIKCISVLYTLSTIFSTRI